MTNPNDPAFITQQTWERGENMVINAGLTKREYFAGVALNTFRINTVDGPDAAQLARIAIRVADALIAELNKSHAPNQQ